MNFDEYKGIAQSRGALAYECYAVTSLFAEGREMDQDVLKDHLAYIGSLEERGALMFAGPLSDDVGENVIGGLIILKAESRDAAIALADGDPMHQSGIRQYTVQRWLINEGGLQISFGLGGQRVSMT